jgi:hypothetical protein
MSTFSWSAAALALCVAAGAARSQTLDRRIKSAGDGPVQFTFPARDGVCGDGSTYLEDGLGGSVRVTDNGFNMGRASQDYRWCRQGPVRVVATVSDGEIVHLRTFAGPPPDRARRSDAIADLGETNVADAVALLARLAESGEGRVAEQALLPLVLADGALPWRRFLRLARDGERPRAVRSSAAYWLSRGASAKLGLTDADESEDDQVRTSAVFALSQGPRSESVPRLIEVARTSRRPAVRAQALFWLGQSGDGRAIDLFEEILR